MSDQPNPPAFSGAIVLKAATTAEVRLLADQLAWYAIFEEPFWNRYDNGYAVKGQVRAQPLDRPEGSGDSAQLLAQAARIGQLEEELVSAKRAHAKAEKQAAYNQKWLDLLTPEEHWRLVGRNLSERGVLVVGPGLGDELVQLIAHDVLERAAVQLEVHAPDVPQISQRAADLCAAIIRLLAPAPRATTPEEVTRQAAQAATIAERFRALFWSDEEPA